MRDPRAPPASRPDRARSDAAARHPAPSPLHLYPHKALARVLLAVQSQGFGDAQAGAEQDSQQRMVAQALVRAMARPCTQRQRRGRQAYLVQPREAFPGGCRFRRRFHALGGTAQGEQRGTLLMQPARKVAHGGVDTRQRGLRQVLAGQRFQERLGHGDEPRVGPIMVVEVLVEDEEALQVAALGVQGRLRVTPLPRS